MGRNKITILIENKLNNHQIYVFVFNLIEINILIAFWGQSDEILWSPTLLLLRRMQANARCGLRENKKKFSKFLEINIFKFIFGISFKK